MFYCHNIIFSRVRRAVAEWLEVHRRPQSTERDKELAARVITLSRFLPEPLKSQEFLAKFSANLLRDNTLMLGNPLLLFFYIGF